jgi:translation initiation factor IF-1
MAPTGWVSLELTTEGRGKLVRYIKLLPDDHVTVQVDWRLRRVRVVRKARQ